MQTVSVYLLGLPATFQALSATCTQPITPMTKLACPKCPLQSSVAVLNRRPSLSRIHLPRSRCGVASSPGLICLVVAWSSQQVELLRSKGELQSTAGSACCLNWYMISRQYHKMGVRPSPSAKRDPDHLSSFLIFLRSLIRVRTPHRLALYIRQPTGGRQNPETPLTYRLPGFVDRAQGQRVPDGRSTKIEIVH